MAVFQKKKLRIILLVLIVALIALPAYRIATWYGVYPVQYFCIGRPSYSKARSTADSFMAKSTDGPWEYQSRSFILDFDGTKNGRSTWVFQYHNPNTRQNSHRIYIRIPEYQVFLTDVGLDPLPLHGSLPR
jgi:hypothetical protein